MNEPEVSESEEQRKFRYKASAFLIGIAGKTKHFKTRVKINKLRFSGISAAAGFGRTLATAKKKDPNFFNKGMTGSIEMAETGSNLAMRALGWGTLFAVLGTGSIAFMIWKLSGAKDVS